MEKFKKLKGFGGWFSGFINAIVHKEVIVSGITAIIAGIWALLEEGLSVYSFVAFLLTFGGALWLWRQVEYLLERKKNPKLSKKTSVILPDNKPQDTFIILSACIERVSLQGNSPAWEMHFTAYNGYNGSVQIESASGTFRFKNQKYSPPIEVESNGVRANGELLLFTVKQWIPKDDVVQINEVKNHIVLGLGALKIEALAGGRDRFDIPLPPNLQISKENHWSIQPETFSRFYRKMLGDE